MIYDLREDLLEEIVIWLYELKEAKSAFFSVSDAFTLIFLSTRQCITARVCSINLMSIASFIVNFL